ncbi:MAG: adenosylcobinamide-GDP ribazoletransferase [Candidatus Eremiobacteraeota bacterium]|nr:adenosylcobinamide-GDP ribazoletransferase [Candidatus Eremiobacteraeota bacterium]
MMRALRALAAAFAYFSVLPQSARAHVGEAPDAYALSWLPFVGAIVGALAGLCGYGASFAFPGFGGIVAFCASIGLTGAIHLDGFLDCCDGLFATASPQQRLAILRDPHHGSFALAGMAMLAAAWIWALSALPPAHLPLVLATTGALARIGALANAWIFPYAREDGMKDAFALRPSVVIACAALVFGIALSWTVAPAAIVLVAVALAAGAGIAWFASRRLGGGITGDVYGAAIVVTEVVLLLGFERLLR